MDESIRIGRIAGISIGINWSLLIVFGLIVWSLTAFFPHATPGLTGPAYLVAAVAAALLFYASLLAHELGHAIVARRLGVEVEGITLWLFGGVAKLRGDAASPGAEAKIAIVGPVVSLALAAIFIAGAFAGSATSTSPLLTGISGWLGATNAFLAVFNMVPAFPLDGGRVLRAALWRRTGNRHRATAFAARAGRVFGYLLMLLGIAGFIFGNTLGGIWSIFLGWFLLNASRAEESRVLLRGALAGLLVRDVMTADPILAPGWITVEEFVRSYVFTHRYATYPVKTFEGELDGLITLTRVQTVAAEERRSTRVKDIACSLEEVPRAKPGDALADLLDKVGRGCGDGRTLVMDGGKLAGIVSPKDITRALQLAALRSP